MTKNLKRFLQQSNAIEGVYSLKADKQARVAWDYVMTEKKMSPGVVLKVHKILMMGQPLQPDERGYFRTVPVYIAGREAPHWSSINGSIKMWSDVVNANNDAQIDAWQMSHVSFEMIHPFVDGNGRTGRILMNWQRLKVGLPIMVIDERDKYQYYTWFN